MSDVSDAERRRQERRQRILNNQEARLKKILGSNSSFERSLSPSTSPFIEDSPLFQVDKEDLETLTSKKVEGLGSFESLLQENKRKGSNFFTENDSDTTKFSQSSTNFSNDRQANFDLLKDQKDNYPLLETKQIPIKIHHLFICLLSLVLSILQSESYFLVYFLLYQFSIFLYNGFSLPLFYSSRNSTLHTLSILFGVPQVQRDRIERVTLIANWLSADLSIFITSALIPHFVSYVFSTSLEMSKQT